MRAKVCYFSGTGNSLMAAEALASELGAPPALPLVQIVGGDLTTAGDDVLVFVFPVYAAGIPRVVVQALERHKIVGNPYIAAVISSGCWPGAALDIFALELKRTTGHALAAGWVVKMPFNYTPLAGAADSMTVTSILTAARDCLQTIADAIRNKVWQYNTRLSLPVARAVWSFQRAVAGRFHSGDRYFRVGSNCTGCGICARVCPVNNIALNTIQRPQWQHHCEHCMACLQFCPAEAIQCFWWTRGRRRYHHPQLTFEKLEAQKKLP